MEYYFCRSYQILNIALYEREFYDKKIVIITESESVEKLCTDFNIEFIKIENYSMLDFILKRKKIFDTIKHLNNIIGNNFFNFSHTQFAIFLFIYLFKYPIQSTDKLIFHDFEEVYSKPSFRRKISSLRYFQKYIMLKSINLLYNTTLELRSATKKVFTISLQQKFIDTNNIKIIKYEKNDFFNKNILLYKNHDVKLDPCNYLYIGLPYKIIPQDFRDNFIKIEQILNTRGFYLKPHPKLIDKDERLVKFKELPLHIPVEFYFKNIDNGIVVGLHSASLITASFFPSIKVVSTLDLLFDPSDTHMQTWKAQLVVRSNNRIIFPKSIDELLAEIDSR